ncbi:MAG: hydrogenase formation HypD protein [Paenibacillus sp.]|jgi:hydrogenase expression/formation protein HypD|nr:hydrogenase formation HypD protein [Paenibacillus sp.]
MKLDAYRDQARFQRLFNEVEPHLLRIREKAGRKFRIMEVCGTHSVAFSKTGVRDLLSPYVDLISGPGCPVCVTDQSDIDKMIAFAGARDVIVATYGDMMKVPGSRSTLEQKKSSGADVRVVTSASEAMELAKRHRAHKVVFLGVGFETTAPGVALSLQRAKAEQVSNYCVYSAHKLTPPALMTLLEDEEHRLDGFILPGHVSVIIGATGWDCLKPYNIPAVIGGFEPVDLLVSVAAVLKEMERPRRSVLNLYPRVVKAEGNRKAQSILQECFAVSPAVWRGFGRMEQSGLQLQDAYRSLDAATQIQASAAPAAKEIRGCRCGEIVKGKESPADCKLFGKACTPVRPLGPCMVSSEGTCSAYFHYEVSAVARRQPT